MSLFVAYAKGGEAHVIADSAAFTGDGKQVGQLVKAKPLTPKMGVLCGVGPWDAHSRFAWELETLPGDFDAAANAFQITLERVWGDYLQENRWMTDALDATGRTQTADGLRNYAVALTGYSEQNRSAVVFHGFCSPQGAHVEGYAAPAYAMAPQPAGIDLTGKLNLPADLLKVARKQHAFLADEARLIGWRNICGGGSIVHYRINRFKIETKVIDHFSTELKDEQSATAPLSKDGDALHF